MNMFDLETKPSAHSRRSTEHGHSRGKRVSGRRRVKKDFWTDETPDDKSDTTNTTDTDTDLSLSDEESLTSRQVGLRSALRGSYQKKKKPSVKFGFVSKWCRNGVSKQTDGLLT